MTEQTIEVFCEKFNVTVDNLVNELFKCHTTMDKITIAVWGIIIVLSTLSLLLFWEKFKQWYKLDYWRSLWIILPIVLIFLGLIIIPFMIGDLICWYVSPLSATLDLIM